jgi:hypothetical protein
VVESCTFTFITPGPRPRERKTVAPIHDSPPLGTVTVIALDSVAAQPASWRVTLSEERLQASRSGVPSSLKSFTAIDAVPLPPVVKS